MKFPAYFNKTIDVRNAFLTLSNCSSEDPDYPGTDVFSSSRDKSWRCSVREAGTGRASITLELDYPTYIQNLKIVNAGSSFVQVDGMISEGSATIPLLPMRMIMSEEDCKASSVSVEYTSTQVFKRSDFAADSFRRFKFLVVTVMQPFRLGHPFGIGRVVVGKPCYAAQIQTQSPELSDPNKNSDIEFSFNFMMKSPKRPAAALVERVRGLNDAVSDENFEMGRSIPMNRLRVKSVDSSKTPTRNTYFASLNERHDIIYKTSRSSKNIGSTSTSTSKTPSSETEAGGKSCDKKSENKENLRENTKSFYGEQQTTPSRKKKKSKLNIVETASETKKGSLYLPRAPENSDEDLPEFALTAPSKVKEEPDTSPNRSSFHSATRSPSFLSVSPGRYSFTKSGDLVNQAEPQILCRTNEPQLEIQPNLTTKKSPRPSGKRIIGPIPLRNFKRNIRRKRNIQRKKKRKEKKANSKTKTTERIIGPVSLRNLKRNIRRSSHRRKKRKEKADSKTAKQSGKRKSPSLNKSVSKTPTTTRIRKSPVTSRTGSSTTKWNSTTSSCSPKVIITITDNDNDNDIASAYINMSARGLRAERRAQSQTTGPSWANNDIDQKKSPIYTPSPRRERKSSDCIIIDERAGNASKKTRKSRRICLQNSKSVRRSEDGDDVLICNPLPSTSAHHQLLRPPLIEGSRTRNLSNM